MMTAGLPEHSPLGASGAYRWLPGACPASVSLAAGLKDEYEDDTFSLPGTCAHAVAAHCLIHGLDAWQMIGYAYDREAKVLLNDYAVSPKDEENGFVAVDKDMADPVQEYLDDVRRIHPDRNQGNTWIEKGFHVPSIHPLFYGATDLGYWDEPVKALHIWDFKYGAGIIVDPEDNPQMKYYAIGLLTELGLWGYCETVVLHIHQPRIKFYRGGVHREWSMPVADLFDWRTEVLVPAMTDAPDSTTARAGDHCRFCPARYRACPAIRHSVERYKQMLSAIRVTPGDAAPACTPQQASEILELHEVYKIHLKAVETVAFGYLMAGQKVPGRKLVEGMAHRVWRDTAEEELKTVFGKKAYAPEKLKSPAEIDKLPGGVALTARHAFKPNKGLTIAAADDSRAAVEKQPVADLIQPIAKRRK